MVRWKDALEVMQDGKRRWGTENHTTRLIYPWLTLCDLRRVRMAAGNKPWPALGW